MIVGTAYRMSLEEVARRAGVSTATVSRVLNNLDIVRSSTRSRVLRAIKELNYHPNLHARTLAGGKSRTIGLIISNLENPFFFDIFRALEAEAHREGYEVVAAHTGYSPAQLVRSVRLMIGRRVAGLAAIVSEMDRALIRELVEAGIPTVFYDVGTAGKNISNIRFNYRRGVERVVDYLHHLGHTRISFIGHHSTLGPTSERERAFVAAMSRYSGQAQWTCAADQDGLQGGRNAVRQVFAGGFNPTAIVCVNDFMAAGALREIRERGLRVPNDVSLTGFDNITLSEFCDPPLTTVHVPRDVIGRLAFEILAPGRSADTNAGREIVLDPELVLRDSTGPAPK
jgi:DNA-binding LacI/PurR family transcriptional regulator